MLRLANQTAYALAALARFGRHCGDDGINVRCPVMLDDLVAGTSLPRHFIAKIFQHLVRGGLLRSNKGRGGGFMPARPCDQISLADIVVAIEGAQALSGCIGRLHDCRGTSPAAEANDASAANGAGGGGRDRGQCPLCELYEPVRRRSIAWLTTTTLADLMLATRAGPADAATNHSLTEMLTAPNAVRRSEAA